MRLLLAIHGNPWFACLRGKPLEDFLALDYASLYTQVIFYLSSLY